MARQELAGMAEQARNWFTGVKTRTSDGMRIWKARDGAPEWITDLCREAHGRDRDGAPAMLPDDWRYLFIVEALDYLADGGDPDDFTPEGDVYTADVLAWLGSHGMRPGYADEAAREYGHLGGVIERVQMGQAAERLEVFELVRAFLAERLAEYSEEEVEA